MPEEDADARFARIEGEMAELREQVTIARSEAAAARLVAAEADQRRYGTDHHSARTEGGGRERDDS